MLSSIRIDRVLYKVTFFGVETGVQKEIGRSQSRVAQIACTRDVPSMHTRKCMFSALVETAL